MKAPPHPLAFRGSCYCAAQRLVVLSLHLLAQWVLGLLHPHPPTHSSWLSEKGTEKRCRFSHH